MQWITMALMLSSGLLLGVILDTYRVLKTRFRLRGWVVSLIDLLYWTVSAALVFSLLMWSNWGELRFYIFVAICTGLFLYYQWLSRQVIQGIRWIVSVIEKLILGILRVIQTFIWLPLIQICRWVIQLLKWLWSLLFVLGKVSLKIFIPFKWLFRPFYHWLSPWMTPLIGGLKKFFYKIRTLWVKFRKKDE
ncbi:spore cortex biosynthesis protein YabQ [Hazenella coriacea]|nr:spore cortex biosynthesis protein YabQ [Hazenella coriacea]